MGKRYQSHPFGKRFLTGKLYVQALRHSKDSPYMEFENQLVSKQFALNFEIIRFFSYRNKILLSKYNLKNQIDWSLVFEALLSKLL